jgi:Caudovirus prohead serine protease
MHHHGVAVEPVEIPLDPPLKYAQVVEGIASTAGPDLSRIRCAPFCFGLLDHRRVGLLYRHDPTQIAGRLESLRYDADGRLIVRATVEHEAARRCNALSVGFQLLDGAIIDPDSADFHALVRSAELGEVSLVEKPSNPACIVTHKMRVPAEREFYSLLQRRIECVIGMARILMEQQHARQST